MRDVERSEGFELPGGCAAAYRFEHDGQEHVIVTVPLRVTLDPALTPAEISVARLIVGGRSNADIARARGTSVRTVANQVASLLRKLGLGSREQAGLRLATFDLGAPEEA
jgi:DNA-binding CsgD family transcriptional regulator